MTDDELQDVLQDLQTNITVVGCGGAGGNTVNRMTEGDPRGEAGRGQHRRSAPRQHRSRHEDPYGPAEDARSRPAPSRRSVRRPPSSPKRRSRTPSTAPTWCSSPPGSAAARGPGPPGRREGRPRVGRPDHRHRHDPFTAEGEVRRTNAEAGLERLRDVSDTVIVVPNDRLLDSVGKLPVRQAFKVSDEVLMRSVKGITELITMPGLVNLDFADVRTVMEKGGVAMIGLGESDSDSKAQDSVKSALRSPLLDVDISSANSALVNVTGGTDMSIEEAEGVVEEIYDRIDPDARIIWGTSVDEELEGEMRTMIVVTGVESPQIYGRNGESAEGEGETPEMEDIDYVE